MTQTDRVLAALTRAGARGITRVDFQLPDVCDGGTPILNIPGRIYDLRNAGIEIAEIGRRQACVVYVLARSVRARAETPAPPEAEEPLFEVSPRNAILGEAA
jgi:hypothetical protein